jgi:hypothetical protein
MQGGCTCENACGLRVGTGNIEFAALFAPKPMGMTTAKDWTIEMPTKGFPELQKHWAMMGAPDNVRLWAHSEFAHNYNIVTREHIYGFFNEHFKLGLPADRLKERDYEPLTREQLTVWSAEHPQPPGGPEFEKKLLRWWYEDAKQQIEKDIPTFRKIAQPAIEALIPRVSPVGLGTSPKYAMIVSEEAVSPYADALKQEGFSVSFQRLAHPSQTEKVKNPRESAAYTFGYNHPLFVKDVQQVLASIHSTIPGGTSKVVLFGVGPAGSAAVAGASALTDKIDAVVLDTKGFRFQNVSNIRDPLFFPNGAKYGDLPGMIALGAPRKLFLMGEPTPPGLVAAAYETAGKPDTLRVSEKQDVDAAVKWLIDALK